MQTLCAIPRRGSTPYPHLLRQAKIVSKKIAHYLDLPDVRNILGVDKAHGSWSECNNLVAGDFQTSLDKIGKTWLYVSNLLERGVRVLNYAGVSTLIHPTLT